MRGTFKSYGSRAAYCLGVGFLAVVQQVSASSVVWSCSRSEPAPEVFEGVKAFRIENLSAKDDYGIAITLSDLYGAYGGESIRMGAHVLSVCALPPQDPLQKEALEMLGFTAQDLSAAKKRANSKLVTIPSIHQMQKCIVENHPAIGFFKVVVESERVGPCF